jgi:hypothetical protein
MTTKRLDYPIGPTDFNPRENPGFGLGPTPSSQSAYR